MDALREKTSDFVARLRRVRADLGAQETRIFSNLSTLGAVVLVLILLLVAAAVGWLIASLNRLDELQRQRQREAMHDSLTGLPNRRYLGEWLNMALAAARRKSEGLVLLYF